MKDKKKNKREMVTKYDVALISQTDAFLLAQGGKESYKCEYDGLFYTYEDIAVDTSTAHTMVEIDDSHNNEMFVIEWEGTGPVFKGRKMFPR